MDRGGTKVPEDPPAFQGWLEEEQTVEEIEADWPEKQKKSQERGAS